LCTTGLVTGQKSMRQALTFASSWPALVSLDLSAWDSFSDSVRELPNRAAQRSVNSHTHPVAPAAREALARDAGEFDSELYGHHQSRYLVSSSLLHSSAVASLCIVLMNEVIVMCVVSCLDDSKGLARLPVGLTRLDVGSTQVTGLGLRYLSRLTALRDLNLASTTRLGVEHLQVTSHY
jgi:hypothetical protein